MDIKYEGGSFCVWGKNLVQIFTVIVFLHINCFKMAWAFNFKIDDCEELSWMQWHSSTDILLAGGKNGIWMWLVTTDTIRQTKVFIISSFFAAFIVYIYLVTLVMIFNSLFIISVSE